MVKAIIKPILKKCIVGTLVLAMAIAQGCGKDPDSNQSENPGGNPDNPGNPTGNAKPEILSIDPTHGMPGTEITITGKHFKDNPLQNYVRFQSALFEATVASASTTTLKVTVPDDATTGKVTVKIGDQTVTSQNDFVVDPLILYVKDINPKQGPFNTQVTIKGTKFGNEVAVKINGIVAPIKQKSPTQIVVEIPVNTSLTAHKLVVTSDGTTVESDDLFTVTATGPYARWENRNIELFPNGASAFNGGLSFVYKNKIYWGFNRLAITTTTPEYAVFDPADAGKGWQLAQAPAGMVSADLQQVSAVVHNDRIFLGTGVSAAGESNAWWEFHPETNTATQLSNFPHRVMGAVSFVLNNNIYVGFGSDNKQLYQFDPAGNGNTGKFDLVTTASFNDLSAGNAFIIGNEVYLGRALPVINQVRNAVYKFTAPDQLVRVADMAEEMPSFQTSAFSVGNKGYFVINRNVWEYTPSSNGGSWRAVIAGVTAPAIQHIAKLTINGSTVIYGWTGSGRLHEFKF
ncbi:IPT/TIG domain-containing protein [Paraflavitalea sp. CAU 1676]|uniref:IPT/TIG domain-containing protein n=1 Tax=Paraflavitalea sp. CAU 1676 TaxID=3032598 RepID=UPI0023DA6619|nr:IPT/TIG domain-containing protein [Paraflavitalea sp. CAU 1676]MDF2189761.1 IPT/TIG domain-containing protein [Paraflavitalea sp. CAU 1676]